MQVKHNLQEFIVLPAPTGITYITCPDINSIVYLNIKPIELMFPINLIRSCFAEKYYKYGSEAQNPLEIGILWKMTVSKLGIKINVWKSRNKNNLRGYIWNLHGNLIYNCL